MRPFVYQPRFFVRFGLFAIATGAAAPAAQVELASESPFMPAPTAGAAAAPTEPSPIEFRGTIGTPEGQKFAIYDTGKKAGTWVQLNEKVKLDPNGLDVEVTAHRIVGMEDQLTVAYGGRTMTLALKEAKIRSSGAPQIPMVANAAPPMPNAVTNSVVVHPSPADEARRLETVAAEVQRRRALRAQAMQQQGSPTPQAQPAVPPPPPQQQR